MRWPWQREAVTEPGVPRTREQAVNDRERALQQPANWGDFRQWAAAQRELADIDRADREARRQREVGS